MTDEQRPADDTLLEDESRAETLWQTLGSTGGGSSADTDGPSPAPDAEALARLAARYDDLGRIGHGGMGLVHRVYDRLLERTVALKVVRPSVQGTPTALDRFRREANITAALQHPGIVPVYDRGELADGRVWYTMREVHGEDLTAPMATQRRTTTGPERAAGLRALVEILARVCDAMTYAHAQRVVHRDLKPSNILIGPFNDVLVVDWGLALRLDDPDDDTLVEDELDTSISSSRHTLLGQVLGTPGYMAPEQARGETGLLGPPTDVHAIGAMLYECLTGRPPRTGRPRLLLAQLRDGAPVERPGSNLPEAMPDELVDLAMRALAVDPAQRPASAAPLGAALRAWLDGSKGRARARAAVEQARDDRDRLRSLSSQIDLLRARALRHLEGLGSNPSPTAKAPAWSLEDQANQLEVELAIEGSAWLLGLQNALTWDPLSAEAHALLAAHYREAHEAAELNDDRLEAARLETLLRTHDRGEHGRYLRGWGQLSLATDPPGADVTLMAYVESSRRRRLVSRGSLGETPLVDAPLSRGSYMLIVRAPGRVEVRYPVLVERGRGWDGIAPGDTEPGTIHLPRPSEMPPGAIYVPAGWFWRGGDPQAADGLPAQRVWVDGFMIQRFPVTHADYMAFLDHLLTAGADSAAWVPRAREGTGDELRPLYREQGGRYTLADPTSQRLDHPVTYIDWHAAMAYAGWYAEQTGLPWRLPDETEWAKAARGIDRRALPWGNHWEPAWARTLDGATESGVAPVDSYPIDESPYGVRGVAGNTCDWCINVWRAEGSPVRNGRLVIEPADPGDGDLRTGRGGIWAGGGRFARLATRFADPPGRRLSVLGLRLVCPWPAAAHASR